MCSALDGLIFEGCAVVGERGIERLEESVNVRFGDCLCAVGVQDQKMRVLSNGDKLSGGRVEG